MSPKARELKAELEKHFDCAIDYIDYGLKLHVKELQALDVHVISDFIEKHAYIDALTVKRSGTGLTVIITI